MIARGQPGLRCGQAARAGCYQPEMLGVRMVDLQCLTECCSALQVTVACYSVL